MESVQEREMVQVVDLRQEIEREPKVGIGTVKHNRYWNWMGTGNGRGTGSWNRYRKWKKYRKLE